jgi:hypothetical protein
MSRIDADDMERYFREMKRIGDDWKASKDSDEQTRGAILLMLVGVCDHLRDRAERLELKVAELERRAVTLSH